MERQQHQQQAERENQLPKATFCQQVQRFQQDFEILNRAPKGNKKHVVAKRKKAYWEGHLKGFVTPNADIVRERSSALAVVGKEEAGPRDYDSPFWRPDVVAWADDAPAATAPQVPRSTFKDFKEEDRPREKLVAKGAAVLTDAELMALILDTGIRGMNVVELAQSLLEQFGGIAGMQSLGVEELTCVTGMGRAKAARILAGFELCRRANLQRRQQFIFRNSAETANHMRPLLADLEQEVFYVVYLNYSNRVITERKVSMGGISATVADPLLMFRTALHVQAVKIILCHNHPSGDLRPSKEDIHLTHKIARIGDLMGVELLDHLVITSDGYFSFADHGMIKQPEAPVKRRRKKAAN